MARRRTVVFLIAAVLAVAVAGTAFAQFRMDIDLLVPLTATLVADIQGTSGETTEVMSEDIPFTFLIPDFQALYQVDLGIVRLGGGVRLYTIILESLIYPTAFVEVKLGPVVGALSLGGFAFGFFGLLNDLVTSDLMIADLSVGYQLTNWFRPNLGVVGFVPFGEITNFFGVFYIGAKFTIIPGQKA